MVPGAITLTLVLVARVFYPRPHELSAGPAEVTTGGLPRVFWLYRPGPRWWRPGSPTSRSSPTTSSMPGPFSPLVPVFYAVAMAVSGIGSLIFGGCLTAPGSASSSR